MTKYLIFVLISLLAASISLNLLQYSNTEIVCSKIDSRWKADYITTNLLHKINYMKERLNQPATIWKIVIFIFGLGVTWSSLNYRISNLEEFQKSVDIIEIQTTLTEIKSDINWIKINMEKIK